MCRYLRYVPTECRMHKLPTIHPEKPAQKKAHSTACAVLFPCTVYEYSVLRTGSSVGLFGWRCVVIGLGLANHVNVSASVSASVSVNSRPWQRLRPVALRPQLRPGVTAAFVARIKYHGTQNPRSRALSGTTVLARFEDAESVSWAI